jgi:hypothetical protein
MLIVAVLEEPFDVSLSTDALTAADMDHALSKKIIITNK